MKRPATRRSGAARRARRETNDMSTPEVVTATPREGKFTKNIARRVRVAGNIPAVVYGAQLPSVAVTVDPKHIRRILHSESGHNTIFDLELSGSTTKVMVVDWQNDPIKGGLIHIDMKRIAMDKAMRVQVPIETRGFRSASKRRVAFWTRSCARSPSSVCPRTFLATSMWT